MLDKTPRATQMAVPGTNILQEQCIGERGSMSCGASLVSLSVLKWELALPMGLHMISSSILSLNQTMFLIPTGSTFRTKKHFQIPGSFPTVCWMYEQTHVEDILWKCMRFSLTFQCSPYIESCIWCRSGMRRHSSPLSSSPVLPTLWMWEGRLIAGWNHHLIQTHCLNLRTSKPR